MTPFEAYKLYNAISMHFTTPSYDYFKYNGKIRADEHTFETRKDKYMFYKLSKHSDPITFLVANFAEGKKVWVGDLFSQDKDLAYNEYIKRKQSLTYIFEICLFVKKLLKKLLLLFKTVYVFLVSGIGK